MRRVTAVSESQLVSVWPCAAGASFGCVVLHHPQELYAVPVRNFGCVVNYYQVEVNLWVDFYVSVRAYQWSLFQMLRDRS